jgi:hypothetical protein
MVPHAPTFLQLNGLGSGQRKSSWLGFKTNLLAGKTQPSLVKDSAKSRKKGDELENNGLALEFKLELSPESRRDVDNGVKGRAETMDYFHMTFPHGHF